MKPVAIKNFSKTYDELQDMRNITIENDLKLIDAGRIVKI
jgi:hypothetical protein